MMTDAGMDKIRLFCLGHEKSLILNEEVLAHWEEHDSGSLIVLHNKCVGDFYAMIKRNNKQRLNAQVVAEGMIEF